MSCSTARSPNVAATNLAQSLEQSVKTMFNYGRGNFDPIVQQYEEDPPEQPWGYGKSLLIPFISFTFENNQSITAVLIPDII